MFDSLLFKRGALLLLTGSAVVLVSTAVSAANNATVTVADGERCIRANGLPDHSTGQFPNSGNPHTISPQNIDYCFPLDPVKGKRAKRQGGSIGVALNGITIRPGTADYWDASSPRGHSRDRSSGWNLEGLGSRDALGMDDNNAHVDNTGMYHYHGVADALLQSTAANSSLIAYAADGFEIHYVPSQTSSYQLKSGTRPSGPKGQYDGSYNEDWEYVANSGSLDQCNGGDLNGQFVYFATEGYPFFPRCLWGNASADFGQQGQKAQGNNKTASSDSVNNGNVNRNKKPSQGERRQPPAAALAACNGKSSTNACSFTGRKHTITGSCRAVPSGDLACVPAGR